jgi:hypothetical protein
VPAETAPEAMLPPTAAVPEVMSVDEDVELFDRTRN